MDDVPHHMKIKALLRAIGIEVKRHSFSKRLLRLVSKKTHYEMRLVVNDHYGPICWECYQSLWQDLVNSKILVDSAWKGEFVIDNPYYGCKSLEEAMVRRDLYGQH